ncbi:hypothetical protein JCM19992_17820 [Thermostilla marina]
MKQNSTKAAIVRLLATAGAIVLAVLAARWLAVAAVPEKVITPSEELARLPLTLDDWSGEEVELDEDLFLATGAACTINRNYSDPGGRAISVHMALFDDREFRMPHPPELCYSGAGWRQIESKDVPLELPNGTSGEVRLLRFERDGIPITVLYAYQMGGPFAAKRDKVRSFYWRFGGRPERPALLKVMLQAPGHGADIENRLTEVAASVLQFAWDVEKDLGLLANP